MQEILTFISLHWLMLFVCSSLTGVIIGAIQSLIDHRSIKWGVLFRWQSWWIGAHWSDFNKRLCVNLIPLLTIWIAAVDGKVPEQGMDIYRSDKENMGSWGP